MLLMASAVLSVLLVAAWDHDEKRTLYKLNDVLLSCWCTGMRGGSDGCWWWWSEQVIWIHHVVEDEDHDDCCYRHFVLVLNIATIWLDCVFSTITIMMKILTLTGFHAVYCHDHKLVTSCSNKVRLSSPAFWHLAVINWYWGASGGSQWVLQLACYSMFI